MNVYDSDQFARMLKPQGYALTDALSQADVILLNTCSIREKAEQKAFSFLGRLAKLKRKKPSLIIGVGGCVAQQEGEKIFKRVPHVDLVFGTRNLGRLPEMIDRIGRKRCRIVDVDMSAVVDPVMDFPIETKAMAPARFVTIMRGCDNFCAYCVVPHVRGRETSRSPDEIVSEIKGLVAGGVREVTLLGQNVNSYGKKEGLCSFPELLARVNAIDGLARIRFTTSHPKDLSDELVAAFGELEKLCRHIHLPVQSGANRILKRMNRKYTCEQYLEKIDKLRAVCPDIAISSDFIVGFPGETDADFDATPALMRRVEFDSVFAFKYSDRPNAPSAAYTDKVLEAIKDERLQTLLALQSKTTLEKNQALVGTTACVLVEGTSKRGGDAGSCESAASVQWSGRSSTNKIVNFSLNENLNDARQSLVGTLVDVRIEEAFHHSLRGKPAGSGDGFSYGKGESYAA